MARQKKPDPVMPDKDPGAALFLELMMQMLAFFILLTSIAVIVDERRLAAIGSLAGTFSPLPKGANLSQGKGPSMPARDIVDGNRAPRRTAKELTEVARELGLGDAIEVLPLDQDSVRVRFPETIVFGSGQVNVSRDMYP
jgi:chemotaxis protein MotB